MIGVGLAIASALGYALSVIFGKQTIRNNPKITTFDVNFARGVVSFIVTIIQAQVSGYSLTTYTQKSIIVLFLSSGISLIRSYSLVVAYTYISGTKALLISNIAPIMIVIMSAFMLNEKISKYTYFLAALTCYG